MSNRQLTITTGASRKSTVWQTTTLLWSEFTERLRTPQRSTESYEDYMRLPKSKQDDLKDVGGFVGGSLSGTRRKASNMTGRDLVTLDLDNIPPGQTDAILKRTHSLSCASVVYSTRKHSEYAPRLRVVIPLDRTCTPDEYEPIARKIAQMVGMEYCDPTTFEASRLMYWPSCSADGIYVFEVYDGNFCSADGVLGLYTNWQDVGEWPRIAGTEEALTRRNIAKQEDPTTKAGLVGAFCRVYDVPAAMAQFLPGIYEETATPDRYTYVEGSTTGGAVVYDNGRFLFSHHATDPCSGQLVNSFDMVRLHKYGDMDEGAKEGTPTVKLPSYTAMLHLAGNDPQVSRRLADERFKEAQESYAGAGDAPAAADVFQVEGSVDPSANQPEETEDDRSWTSQLTVDGNGRFQKTISNVHLILRNDPRLKGRIKLETFSNKVMLTCPVPWDRTDRQREWKDSDYDGTYEYIETFYGISSRQVIDSALNLVGEDNKENAVEIYLKSLKWDGKKRVDTLLIDYLGVDDNIYTREVMRKWLVAAVARAIEGGVKFDYMPILSGAQGIGKTTLVRRLGTPQGHGDWYNDSLTTFEGKDAAENIRGSWIVEVGELAAMNRYEINTIKLFLSKQDDRFREAYGRKAASYSRRCVFIGTSNETEFLRDKENRRFWPIDCKATENTIINAPDELFDQVWAEAYALWQVGESLTLSTEAEALARIEQKGHKEVDVMEGVVLNFLDLMVPPDWNVMDLNQKKMFLSGNLMTPEGEELQPINQVCAREIYELLIGSRRYMKNYDAKKINDIIRGVNGWVEDRSLRFKNIGQERGFLRQISVTKRDDSLL